MASNIKVFAKFSSKPLVNYRFSEKEEISGILIEEKITVKESGFQVDLVKYVKKNIENIEIPGSSLSVSIDKNDVEKIKNISVYNIDVGFIRNSTSKSAAGDTYTFNISKHENQIGNFAPLILFKDGKIWIANISFTHNRKLLEKLLAQSESSDESSEEEILSNPKKRSKNSGKNSGKNEVTIPAEILTNKPVSLSSPQIIEKKEFKIRYFNESQSLKYRDTKIINKLPARFTFNLPSSEEEMTTSADLLPKSGKLYFDIDENWNLFVSSENQKICITIGKNDTIILTKKGLINLKICGEIKQFQYERINNFNYKINNKTLMFEEGRLMTENEINNCNKYILGRQFIDSDNTKISRSILSIDKTSAAITNLKDEPIFIDEIQGLKMTGEVMTIRLKDDIRIEISLKKTTEADTDDDNEKTDDE
jgi:hypothetical protein